VGKRCFNYRKTRKELPEVILVKKPGTPRPALSWFIEEAYASGVAQSIPLKSSGLENVIHPKVQMKKRQKEEPR